VSEAADFIDAALQHEASPHSAVSAGRDGLLRYGASIGAIRGSIRDATRRYHGMSHDEITALSSELWSAPVFERRLAAVVLLQSNAHLLRHSDLTRLEGFIRSAGSSTLVDPLVTDVLRPLLDGLDDRDRARVRVVIERWIRDPDAELRRAAVMLERPIRPNQ
jgi:DNA alkylation repair enzyme